MIAPAGSGVTWAADGSPTIRSRPSAALGSSRSRGCRSCCGSSARTVSSITSPLRWPPSPTQCTRRRRSISGGTFTNTGDAVAIVAGVDFGTQSVRLALVDSERGPLGCGIAEYPVLRARDDPDFATQSHDAHMKALAAATRLALTDAGVDGTQVRAMALDTTGSTVVPVG